ncbi:MAG: GH36 C-terminal domain-containing protein [Lentisphaeria bacterium]|nr:GH36 C-terminal domain-containing protein [Lentisphaeria bacterium]
MRIHRILQGEHVGRCIKVEAIWEIRDKTFIRPILPTCKVYHHAPLNATGGVETGEWFAMEFVSSDSKKGWAVIIRLAETASDTYQFTPKGLDGEQQYRVAFDNTRRTDELGGAHLAHDGLPIQLGENLFSELLLFEV